MYQLPITLKQSNPKLSRLPGLMLMTALAAMIVLPQVTLAAYAVASSNVRSALMDHPLVALQLAAALAVWVALVCWPLRNIVMSLLSSRLVDIRNGEVLVVDKTPFAAVTWRMPLTTYEGIILHARSSLSGIRHEAILVHPDRSRSVILMVAEHIGAREILELCRVLQLPNIPADRLYHVGGPPPGGNTDNLAAAII